VNTQRRHTITIEFGDNAMEFLIPYSDAKKDLEFDRIEQDLRNGKKGLVGECMDHKCIKRLPHVFPHPAHYAEVTADRVWVVDKVNKLNQPTHCVRYVRPRKDSEDIRIFDTKSKKTILAGKTSMTVERPIFLLAPRKYHKTNPWGNTPHPDKHDGSKKKPAVRVGEPAPRGAMARKIRAGLLSI